MSVYSEGRARSNRSSFWYVYVVAFQILIGAPSFIAEKAGSQFLPSPRWATAVDIPAWIVGILFALFFVWVIYARLIPIFNVDGFTFKMLFIYIAASYFWLFLGWSAVTSTIPMVISAISNKTSFVVFAVSDATKFGYRGCRHPVYLQDMPFFSNKICNVSPELRKVLSPGSPIIVIGHGTWRGLYAERISKAD